MGQLFAYLEDQIKKLFVAGGTAAKHVIRSVLKILAWLKSFKTLGLVALTVYISVAINAYYRPIQEVVHDGIIWTYEKNEVIGNFMYEANALLFNGKDFDRERSAKKVIYDSYQRVVMVNIVPVDMENTSARSMAGRGTGWFYHIEKDEAYIVTNYHVVQSAINSDQLEIKVATGIDMWDYEAELVGVDEIADIAIIKIIKKDNEEWETLKFEEYDEIGTGDSVVVVGHGMGMTFTSTQGSITYKERYGSRPYNLMLQVDAIINQGNSGGPIINMKGNVVGVAQSILSPARQIPGWDGVGLAVGARNAQRSIEFIMGPQYHAKGYVPYVEFPFSLGNVEFGAVKDVPKKDRYLAMIDYVDNDESATKTVGEMAGFEQDDIIMEINGERIGSSYNIIKMMIYAFPGDEWNIKFRRGDEEMNKIIALREIDRNKLLQAVNPPRGR